MESHDLDMEEIREFITFYEASLFPGFEIEVKDITFDGCFIEAEVSHKSPDAFFIHHLSFPVALFYLDDKDLMKDIITSLAPKTE